jgi:hypothetical protein
LHARRRDRGGCGGRRRRSKQHHDADQGSGYSCHLQVALRLGAPRDIPAHVSFSGQVELFNCQSF